MLPKISSSPKGPLVGSSPKGPFQRPYGRSICIHLSLRAYLLGRRGSSGRSSFKGNFSRMKKSGQDLAAAEERPPVVRLHEYSIVEPPKLRFRIDPSETMSDVALVKSRESAAFLPDTQTTVFGGKERCCPKTSDSHIVASTFGLRSLSYKGTT